MKRTKFAWVHQKAKGKDFSKQRIEEQSDTNQESMCHMHTKLNSNAHWHNKVNDGDCIQLDIQNCHHTLYNIIV